MVSTLDFSNGNGYYRLKQTRKIPKFTMQILLKWFQHLNFQMEMVIIDSNQQEKSQIWGFSTLNNQISKLLPALLTRTISSFNSQTPKPYKGPPTVIAFLNTPQHPQGRFQKINHQLSSNIKLCPLCVMVLNG